jgi:hypothetical protein
MFIRTKRDWKQTYFYLVESYRDKEGRPRQHSVYLGTTLNMSAEKWASVRPKVEQFVVGVSAYSVVYDAVRAYCKKHGLLLKTAETVRAAARLIKEKQDAELAERLKQLREAQRKREREQRAAREKEEREERWAYQLRFGVGSDMVSNAFSVLGVCARATKEEVKTAFRKAARVHHPDLGGDPAKFRVVAEAKETLDRHFGTT